MEIGYEEKFDVLGIILKDNYKFKQTLEVEPLFVVDIDKNNKIVAMEIIDIARRFGVTTQHIKSADIKPFVLYKEGLCEVGVDFEFLNGRRERIFGKVVI